MKRKRVEPKTRASPRAEISIGRQYDLLLVDDSGEVIKIDFAGQIVCVADDVALLLARSLIESVVGRMERQGRGELPAAPSAAARPDSHLLNAVFGEEGSAE